MRVVRQVSMAMQPYAVCAEDSCPWEREESSISREQAKQHVRDSGHEVVVVTAKRDLYRRED